MEALIFQDSIPDKIGLISDTHDAKNATKKVLDIFQSHGITTILHAGDVTQPDILELFSGFDLYLVLGNCDDQEKIKTACKKYKIKAPKEFLCLSYKDSNIFLFHGYPQQVPLFRQLCNNNQLSYIIKGHTHTQEDYWRNGIHVINPGCIDPKNTSSCAILDLNHQKVDFYNI